MKFDSYVGVITNSSSMLYVLQSEKVAAVAKDMLAEYGTTLLHSSNPQDMETLLYEAGHVLHDIFWRLPEYKHIDWEPSATYQDRRAARRDAFDAEMREKIKDIEPFYFFLPHREDNEMSVDEMNVYDALSSRSTRLS